jgi:glycosyltransferase involved in cell wall biosynthesis
MRILVLGIRGMPNVQGGVETHAEHLYQRLAELGCTVEVIVRTPFVPRAVHNVGQIRLRRIWSPTTPGLEALVHSFLGVLYAGISRPDILHIHAVGPAIVAPFARLFGLKVVVTHHGPDYDRDKWGRFARWVLRTGESSGVRYSHARIAISRVISELIRSRYGVESDLIPNGVMPVTLCTASEHVRELGLEPGKYVLQVSRIVPEKRQLDLIQAFKAAQLPGWKLVLVGGGDSSNYCQEVQAAARSGDVVLTGFRSGVPLAQLYSHAGIFVLPSSHEGLPIAMLEALSYGVPVIASNIPANFEVGLDPGSYFPVGDIPALARRLEEFAIHRQTDAETRTALRSWVIQRYNWETIAQQTLAVYRRVFHDRDDR